jgi:hypothetical protein
MCNVFFIKLNDPEGLNIITKVRKIVLGWLGVGVVHCWCEAAMEVYAIKASLWYRNVFLTRRQYEKKFGDRVRPEIECPLS